MIQYIPYKDGDNITITIPSNTTYTPTSYNNTTYHNTQEGITAEKNGKKNTFTLLHLHQVTIPYNPNKQVILYFKDTIGNTHPITIPQVIYNFEDGLSKQFPSTQVNNMGYMYGFIKTLLFNIYTNKEINKILTQNTKT